MPASLKSMMIVSDDPDLCGAFERMTPYECRLDLFPDDDQAIKHLADGVVDIVFFDGNRSDARWLDFFAQARLRKPGALRVLLADIRLRPEAFERIADGHLHHFLSTPVQPEEIRHFLRLMASRTVSDAGRYIERELDHVREYNETILNNMLSGLIVCDGLGRIVKANRAAHQILQMPMNDLLNRRVNEFFGMPIGAGDREGEYSRRSDVHLLLSDGEEIVVSMSVSPFGGLSGSDVLNIITFTDDTGINRLKSQLIQSEKMAGIGTLARGVAHEFNNLIGGMLGFAQLAEATDDIEDYRRCNQVVFEASKRAKTIIGNLLSFARREPSRIEIMTLKDLVEQVVSLIERELNKANINIVMEIDPSLLLEADLSEFQQVLLNLFINAMDAMEEKQGGVLTIRGRRDAKMIRLDVEDTGIGIRPELLPRIFEPFYSTKGSIGAGKISGTGLGLSQCYGIVKKMGGAIAVRSSLGVGAVFMITIPDAGAPSDSDSFLDPTSESIIAEADLPQLRILVIDDELMILDLLTNILQKSGHVVDRAGNGYAGVEKARFFDPDVAIIDAQMPGLTGVETCAQLRAEHPDLKILMMTGKAGMDFDNFQAEMGKTGVEVLRKPFEMDDIRQALASVTPRVKSSKEDISNPSADRG